VIWTELGRPATGALEVTPHSLVLSAREATRVVPYDELLSVRVGRRATPGGESRPALVLECRGGTRLEVAPIGSAGVVHELAEEIEATRGRLASASAAPASGA
jgi:hypothetical protein